MVEITRAQARPLTEVQPAPTAVDRVVEDYRVRGGQFLGGLLDMVSSSPAAREELGTAGAMVPNGVWMTLSLPDILSQIVGNLPPVRRGLESVGLEPGIGFLEPITRYATSTFEQTDRNLDLPAPRDTLDLLLRNSAPGPGIVSRNAPLLLRAAQAVALPGVQSRTPAGVLAEVGLPTAGVAAAYDELDPNFSLVGEGPSTTPPATPPSITRADARPWINPQPGMTQNVPPPASITSDQARTVESLDGGLADYYIAAGVLGGILVGSAGSALNAYRVRRYQQALEAASRVMGTPVERNPTLRGGSTSELRTPPAMARGPITGRGWTTLLDTMAGVHRAINRAQGLSDEHKAFVSALLRATTPQGIAARTQFVLREGTFLDYNTRLPPYLSTVFEPYSRLSQADQVALGEGLIAGTVLDNMSRPTAPATWGPYSKADLQSWYDNVQNTPHLRQIADVIRDSYARLLELHVEADIVASKNASHLRTTNPRYVPLQLALKDRYNLGATLTDKRDPLRKLSPGTLSDPVRELSTQISAAVRRIEQERVKREFVNAVLNRLEVEVDGRRMQLLERAKKSNRNTHQHMTIRRGGKEEVYRVNDEGIWMALQFNPRQAIRLLNESRRMFQEFTTGLLQPFFVPTSILYDMWTTTRLKQRGDAIGVLDQVTKRAFGQPISDIIGIDPSIVMSPLIGAARGIGADVSDALSKHLFSSLTKNGVIASMLGPARTLQLAGIMRRAYVMSHKYQFERLGGTSAAPISNQEIFSAKAVQDISPKLNELGTGPISNFSDRAWRMYKGLLFNLHNAIRLQHFVANRPLQRMTIHTPWGPKTAVTYSRDLRLGLTAMQKTRRSSGDFTQTGGLPQTKAGRAFQRYFLNAVPYANHAVQVAMEHARMMKKQPGRYFMTYAGVMGGIMAYASVMSDEDPNFLDFYWRKMTATERSALIPVMGADGTVHHFIAIAPEDRVILAPLMEAFGTLMGYKQAALDADLADMRPLVSHVLTGEWSEFDTNDMWQAFTAGLSGNIPVPVPPVVVGAAEAAFGVEAPQWTLGRYQSFEPRPNRADPLAGEGIGNEATITRVESMLEGIMGASAIPIMDAIQAVVHGANLNYDFEDIIKSAGSAMTIRYQQPRTLGLLGFMGVAHRTSVADPIFHSVTGRMQAVERIINLGNQTIRSPGGTRINNPAWLLEELNLSGTEFEFVFWATQDLNSNLQDFKSLGASLRTLQDETMAHPVYTDAETRNFRLNEITEQRRNLNAATLNIIKQYEDIISQHLGREFSYANYDMNQSASVGLGGLIATSINNP